MHSTTPARDTDRVRVPGEPELESMAERETNGIPIDDNSWTAILRAADRAGLTPERIATLTEEA